MTQHTPEPPWYKGIDGYLLKAYDLLEVAITNLAEEEAYSNKAVGIMCDVQEIIHDSIKELKSRLPRI